MTGIIAGENVAIEYPPVDTELMNKTATFTDHTKTELSETTIETARDSQGRLWTMVSTSWGEDTVITPAGEHVSYDPWSAEPAVEAFVAFLIEMV